jgi:hypothetical protein
MEWEAFMSILQAVLLGVVLTWTPSLILVAMLSWRLILRSEKVDRQPSQRHDPTGYKAYS